MTFITSVSNNCGVLDSLIAHKSSRVWSTEIILVLLPRLYVIDPKSKYKNRSYIK